jgi:hypothetical protein
VRQKAENYRKGQLRMSRNCNWKTEEPKFPGRGAERRRFSRRGAETRRRRGKRKGFKSSMGNDMCAGLLSAAPLRLGARTLPRGLGRQRGSVSGQAPTYAAGARRPGAGRFIAASRRLAGWSPAGAGCGGPKRAACVILLASSGFAAAGNRPAPQSPIALWKPRRLWTGNSRRCRPGAGPDAPGRPRMPRTPLNGLL